jgi:hypothetical protein
MLTALGSGNLPACSGTLWRSWSWISAQMDGVAQALRQAHPESFRAKIVTCRNGQKRAIWAFTKIVRL